MPRTGYDNLVVHLVVLMMYDPTIQSYDSSHKPSSTARVNTTQLNSTRLSDSGARPLVTPGLPMWTNTRTVSYQRCDIDKGSRAVYTVLPAAGNYIILYSIRHLTAHISLYRYTFPISVAPSPNFSL